MFKDARGRGKYGLFSNMMMNGQVNVSYSYPETIRAFHRHKKQYDCWYVVKGNLEVALYNEQPGREGKPLTVLYLSEGDDPLIISPYIWHGFRVLGNEEAVLLYYVTMEYDPDNPDEERAEWNAFYDWETPKK